MGTRIRDVVQGPDGAVYALTDESEGKILRLCARAARLNGQKETGTAKRSRFLPSCTGDDES